MSANAHRLDLMGSPEASPVQLVESPAIEPARAARILVVDDDHVALKSLSDSVAACGHEPLPAATWAQAVRTFRRERPDVVILDLVMPTIDGYKLAAMIKNESGGFVPVILLTALTTMETRRRAVMAGADDVLSKPASTVELKIRLQAMLRIRTLTDRLERANRRLEQLATTDALTKLLNRRAIQEQTRYEFERARRYRHPLSLFMLDVDHFKRVNDTRGHGVGDLVLSYVGRVLDCCARKTDFVGRYGGEEFLIVAPQASLENGRVMAERFRHAVEQGTASEADLPDVTVSIGVSSSIPAVGETFEVLLRRADVGLYEAKNAGRNQCVAAG